MKPSIGRIVHYVQDGEHFPAIIVKVHNETLVNVQQFRDEPAPNNAVWETSVSFDDTPTPSNHTWHWPERIPE